jgi:2-dehydropantoate 2-reductase
MRLLVVGAGAIGGVVAANLAARGSVSVLTTNTEIAEALRGAGFRVRGKTGIAGAPAPEVLATLPSDGAPFDVVFLATQPPQVEEAARGVAPRLASDGRVVCFQNGLCEDRVAAIVGRERVVGAVVAWGASMLAPGVYERTSEGGFTLGCLDGSLDGRLRAIGELLAPIGTVRLTENLIGSRWSKLAINCAISTLGTIGGDRVGVLMRKRFVRRLAMEIMTETVAVARAESVRLEKVAGTLDLDWLALTSEERVARGSARLATKHGVLYAAGLRYRRLRSSMLAAIERGRPPAVDFLNGEVVARGEARGIATPANRAAAARVWQIARGEARASHDGLRALYAETR